ncbi:MAG: hypothetical protein GY865_11410 [candidate division Zixibacteria bacterium]|nr:hypothetical protein [candidate division Zixibacteria bacterium]
MNSPSENTEKLFTPQNIVILLLVLCSYLILYLGYTFTEINWGIDQVTYLSENLYIFWIIISIVSIILLLAGIKKHILSDFLADFLWGDKKIWGRWLVVILSMFLFYYFRFEAHLYGEGYIRIGNLAQKSKPLILWHEFGSVYIPYLFYQALVTMGMAKMAASIWAYQLLSILSGGIFLFFSIKISDLLYENYHDKITSLFLMMLSGITMMFFGMVDNYSILLPFAGIAVYLIVKTIQTSNKKYLTYLWGITLLGIVINFQFITFMPPLLFVSIKLLVKRVKAGSLFGLLSGLFSIIFAVIILYINSGNNMGLENLVLLLRGKSPEAYYWLFSRVHLLDIYNLVFLFVPLFLVFIYAIIFGFKNLKKESLFIILSLLVLAQTVYLFIIDPKSGMIRDIPQYGFLLFGFVCLGSYAVIRLRKQVGLSQSIVMGLCPVALVLMLPGLIVHLSPLKTEESINKYLKYNESKNKTGLIALRDHFFSAGDMDKSNYYDQIVSDKDPGALQSQIVGDLFARGRVNEAFDYANQLVQRYPYNFIYRLQRANILNYYKRFGDVKAELDTALILAPHVAEPYHYLAQYYHERKLERKCLDILNDAFSFAPDNTTILIDLTAYYYRSGITDKADSLSKAVMAIDSMVPYSYLYQAFIADGQQQYDRAMEMYSKFIEINDRLPEVSSVRKRQNEIFLLQRDKKPSN